MTTRNRLPAAIFWDMDGTLVDSEPLWGIATYELSEKLGRRITPEVRERTVGGSFANTLSILSEWAGVDVEYGVERRWMYRRMAELMAGRLKPNPGVRELLAELTSEGLPMLVTTNTERELADPSIDAVGREFFVDSITGDEVTRPKPHPDMYVEAARRVGRRPAECLVFEDSMAGMTAAAASGARVIGLADHTPAGVVPMRALAGEIGFDGVSARTLGQWWASLTVREEL